MPPWVLKAALQGTLSLLPGSNRTNEVLQRINGTLSLTPDRFSEKYEMALRHLRAAEEHGGGLEGATVLEVGTGWHPIVPIALTLHGARSVVTTDVQSLLSVARVAETIDHFRRIQPHRGTAWRPGASTMLDDAVRQEGRSTPAAMLRLLGVDVRVGHIAMLEPAERAFDVIVTNNTLEHVPAVDVRNLLVDLRRLASSGAVSSHWIDLRDHYASFDGSITIYNFLRYSDRQWRPFNNRLQYQNRLRADAYRRLHQQAGWQIVSEESKAGSLGGIRLARPFAEMAPTDVAISELHLISTPS